MEEYAITRDHQVVGGWLLLLCILLVFATPASVLYSIFSGALPKLVAGVAANRKLLLSSYCALFLGVAVCSVWVGIKLWLAHPNADRYARMYLVLFLAAHIAYFAFWYFVSGHPTSLGLASMGYYHVVGPVASTALWYFYLENSDRVRKTYRT